MQSSLTNTESCGELLFAAMTFAKVRLVRYTVAMNLSRSIRLIILLLVLGGTVGCDQTTKHIARKKLNQFDTVMVLGGLGELQLAENSGAFLSLGDSLPQAIRTLVFTFAAGIGLLAMFVYLLLRPRWHWLAFFGIAFVMAGGASNLIDRTFAAASFGSQRRRTLFDRDTNFATRELAARVRQICPSIAIVRCASFGE